MTGTDSPDNYCYRHPKRQSFVLCQRCGRTICGQCQTTAAVGFVCPECMKEQKATAPRRRPTLLRRTAGQPVVTYTLIALCAVVYIGQWIPGLHVTQELLWAGLYSYPFAFEPWRMLTVMFVHSTGFIFHILLNMYTLWIFGRLLEPVIGRARFAALYLMAGFGGSLGVMFLADPRVPTVGASGAIFGLMGAFLVIQRRLGGNTTQLLILIGINVVIGFIPGTNIAWQAHLGGLAVGALIGFIFVETRSPQRQPLQKTLLVALGVVLVLLACKNLIFA